MAHTRGGRGYCLHRAVFIFYCGCLQTVGRPGTYGLLWDAVWDVGSTGSVISLHYESFAKLLTVAENHSLKVLVLNLKGKNEYHINLFVLSNILNLSLLNSLTLPEFLELTVFLSSLCSDINCQKPKKNL